MVNASDLEELREDIENLRKQIPDVDKDRLKWLNEIDPLISTVGALAERVRRIEVALAKAGIKV